MHFGKEHIQAGKRPASDGYHNGHEYQQYAEAADPLLAGYRQFFGGRFIDGAHRAGRFAQPAHMTTVRGDRQMFFG